MLSSWLIVAEAERVAGLLRAFDDEGRGVVVELVGMGPDPAVLGLLEDEGEGVVEFLMRAEPDELAQAQRRCRAGRLSANSARVRELIPSAATTRS